MSALTFVLSITPLPQVRKHFTVDDHSHYIFTPRDLTRWVVGLMRYPLAEDSSSSAGKFMLSFSMGMTIPCIKDWMRQSSSIYVYAWLKGE